MTNAHEAAATELMSAMLRDPECAPVLVDTAQELRRGQKFSPQYAGIFGLFDGRTTNWPMEQAACFLSMHAGLNAGQFAMVSIDLLAEPGADAQREQNAYIIADLPEPFIGKVDLRQNSSSDGDGAIGWVDTIVGQRGTGLPEIGGSSVVFEECLIRKPHRSTPTEPVLPAPLEIGTTKASVVYAHLVRSKAVARRPYGSTSLTIIVDTTWYGVPAGHQAVLPAW